MEYDIKKIIIISSIAVLALIIGTIIIAKITPKMHPTMIIEKLIIKTNIHKTNP